MPETQRVPSQEERTAFVEAARALRGRRDNKTHLSPEEMEMVASWGATLVRSGRQTGGTGYYVEMELDGERFTSVVRASSRLLQMTRR